MTNNDIFKKLKIKKGDALTFEQISQIRQLRREHGLDAVPEVVFDQNNRLKLKPKG